MMDRVGVQEGVVMGPPANSRGEMKRKAGEEPDNNISGASLPPGTLMEQREPKRRKTSSATWLQD